MFRNLDLTRMILGLLSWVVVTLSRVCVSNSISFATPNFWSVLSILEYANLVHFVMFSMYKVQCVWWDLALFIHKAERMKRSAQTASITIIIYRLSTVITCWFFLSACTMHKDSLLGGPFKKLFLSPLMILDSLIMSSLMHLTVYGKYLLMTNRLLQRVFCQSNHAANLPSE